MKERTMKRLILIFIMILGTSEAMAFDWRPVAVNLYPGVVRYTADYEKSQETAAMSIGAGLMWDLGDGFFGGVDAQYVYIENMSFPFGYGNGWVKKKRYMLHIPFKLGYMYDMQDVRPFVYLAPTLAYKLSARNVSHIKPIADDPIFNTGFYADNPLLMEDGGYGIGLGVGLYFNATQRVSWMVDVRYHYGLRTYVGPADEPNGPRARAQGFSFLIGFGYDLKTGF